MEVNNSESTFQCRECLVSLATAVQYAVLTRKLAVVKA